MLEYLRISLPIRASRLAVVLSTRVVSASFLFGPNFITLKQRFLVSLLSNDSGFEFLGAFGRLFVYNL